MPKTRTSKSSPSQAQAWAGIDVSAGWLDACLIVGDGEPVYTQVANTEPGWRKLQEWARKAAGGACVHFCMEATGRYSLGPALALSQAGQKVSVVNPAVIKYSGARGAANKTDKADARKIALFAKKENPALWAAPSEEQAVLRELTRHLATLKEDLARQKTRLKEPHRLPEVRKSLEAHAKFLEEQIKAVQDEIDSHCQGHEALQNSRELLKSVPGIGPGLSAVLAAEIPPIEHIPSAQSLAAMFGLSPRQCQSGKSSRPARISKCGSSDLRAALYLPAMSAIKHNPRVKALADRLAAKGMSNMAIIAAAMRKLLMICCGVLKHQNPYKDLPETA